MRWSEACESKKFHYPLTRRHPHLVSLYATAAWAFGASGLHRLVPCPNYLYRGGLALSWCGRHRMALRLLGAAASRFRKDERVVELARLRVNEAVVRFRASEQMRDKHRLNEEIVLRMSRIDALESPEPPFSCLPVSDFLAIWMSRRTLVLGHDEVPRTAEPIPVRPAA